MKRSNFLLTLSLLLLVAGCSAPNTTSSASPISSGEAALSSGLEASSSSVANSSAVPSSTPSSSSPASSSPNSSALISSSLSSSSPVSSSSSSGTNGHLTGNATIDAYYSTVDWTLTGQAMKEQIANLLKNKQSSASLVGYKGMRTYLAKCDLDPNGSGKILGFYDEQKVGPSWDSGSTWNREHVWPDSLGGGLCEHDPHMVRACATSSNGDRGNKFFAASGAYDPGQFIAKYRGISARIIFYCATKYWSSGLALNDGVTSDTKKKEMGKLSDMLAWNNQYPVDVTETHRNEVIFGDYNLRNPFIDHPELADIIFGA
ncbi:MAG: endonuclease [Bacilli bacterium]|nr:endonuclease [Bacilli bacterium]